MQQQVSSAVADELRRADLGDQRLSKRLGRIAAALSKNPGESLPAAMVDNAALEATYRFMSNPKVSPEAILAPHLDATYARANREDVVLVVHDTTSFEFNGESRTGLGRTSSSAKGFFGHVALAMAEDRRPLGVAGFHSFVRDKPAPGREKRRRYAYRKKREHMESDRWSLLVDRVEAGIDENVCAVHVMDREADSYALMANIRAHGSHFVIRANHDRVVVTETESSSRPRLRDQLGSAPPVFERDVPLSGRTPKYPRFANRTRVHPPRDARMAHLVVSATSVTIARSWALPATLPRGLALNVVRVFEPNPPPDTSPVEWLLLTDLPIDTEEQVARIIDAYRSRWLIEEFFKAIKTGCRYEKLQLESATALLNALAVLLPVAHQMLLLRHLSREQPDHRALDVLTETQVEVLRALSKKPLSRHPTAAEALLAVAALGGHIKNNGNPGWLVLYRGFRDLLLLELGWKARCDQS